MGSQGIVWVQHGDFPFDFKDREKPMFDMIEVMLGKLSEKTRGLPRRADDPYSCDTSLIADAVRLAGGFRHFEVGYMEFSSPSIEEAAGRLESRGVGRIVFVNSPGLMMRSSHSLLDIPALLKGVQARHPCLELIYAAPGVPFDAVARLFVKRIDAALGKVSPPSTPPRLAPDRCDFGVVMVAHGDIPLEYLSSMGSLEMRIDAWSEIVKKWPRTESNDPLYIDTLRLERLIRDIGGYDNFETGYLEFAAPTLDDALEKVVSRGATSVLFVGGTGFCDRSSHTLKDIPAAIRRLQEAHPHVRMAYASPDIAVVGPDFAAMIADKAYRALETGGLPI